MRIVECESLGSLGRDTLKQISIASCPRLAPTRRAFDRSEHPVGSLWDPRLSGQERVGSLTELTGDVPTVRILDPIPDLKMVRIRNPDQPPRFRLWVPGAQTKRRRPLAVNHQMPVLEKGVSRSAPDFKRSQGIDDVSLQFVPRSRPAVIVMNIGGVRGDGWLCVSFGAREQHRKGNKENLEYQL